MKNDTAFGHTDTIGIDIGDKTSHYCVVRGGKQIKTGTFATTPETLEDFLTNQERCRVVFEVGAQSPWFADVITPMSHIELFVCNAAKLSVNGRKHRKNDRLDAQRLALLGSRDDASIYDARIFHRQRPVRQDLSVVRSRDFLVGLRSQAINHLRGAVKSYGVRLPVCSPEAIVAKKVRLAIPEDARPFAYLILEEILRLNHLIRRFDKLIERRLVPRHPKTQLLTPVVGVGNLTALCVVLVAGDTTRFKNAKEFAAYLGLAVGVHESGDTKSECGITKTGDALTRRLLVQCGHYVLSHQNADSDLRRFGLKLLERGGKSARKRAVVAVARKLATILFHLLTTGEVYDPFHNTRKVDPGSIAA